MAGCRHLHCAGPVSSLVVVDSDSEEAHAMLVSRLGGEPETLTAISGSRKPGKLHYYFRNPEWTTAATYRPWHQQLEFRGKGGYVVAPPSLHKSGHRYEWLDPDFTIAELPPVLAESWRGNPRFGRPLLKNTGPSGPVQRYGVSARTLHCILSLRGLAHSTADWLMGSFAQQTGWNNRLFVAACDLAALGVPHETAEPLLLRGAQPNTDADERMAISTITSAYSCERVSSRECALALGTNTDSVRTPEVVSTSNGVRLLGHTRSHRRFSVGN